MGSAVVVGGDRGGHGLGALCGGLVGSEIGPFAQGGLDEALGLSVGSGRIGPGADVPEAGLGDMALEEAAAIGGAVVGHDALDADAMRLEEGEGANEETAGALL